MSESPKFTPGPWEVLKGPSGWIQTMGDPYGHGSMHVADARGWGHLTGVGACGFGQEEAIEIQDANASLISAAPEMYELLREWEAYFDTATSGRPPYGPILDRTKAVLSKASRS